jgi:hypothetical protein
VRSQTFDQQAAFAQRFGNKAEVEHFQVAEPAMDELAGPAGRARGEVARLHQTDAEAARGRVERRAAADHAAADDQDVELL